MQRVRPIVLAGALAIGAATATAAVHVGAIRGPATVARPAVRGDALDAGSPTSPGSTRYRVPIADGFDSSWHPTHASYPATDLFAGCGVPIVSPVDGEVIEVRRVDSWDPSVDNPATRGGRSVEVLGDDGVRYYFAHFATIGSTLAVGDRIEIGAELGTMGDTGRTSACHLHFGISPPCPGKEWSIRRGVVWPYPYLDAWERGEQLSPATEVTAWSADHPDACAAAIADPHAPDA